MISAAIVVVLAYVGSVSTSPVRYDLRQEGGTNVQGEIENIVFAIVEPQNIASELASFWSNTIFGRRRSNHPSKTASQMGYIRPEKSPYRVDLEKSNVPVSKLEADPSEVVVVKVEPEEPTKTVKKDLTSAIELRSSEIPVVEVVEVVKEEMAEKKKEEKNKEKKEVEKKKGEKLEEKKKEEKTEEKKEVEKKKEEKTEEKKEIEKKKEEKTEEKKEVEKKKEEKTEEKKEIEKKKDTEKKKETEKEVAKVDRVISKRDSKENTEELVLIGEAIEQCGYDGHRDSTGKCVY